MDLQTKLIKAEMKKGDNTTYTNEIHIIKEYFENLCSNKNASSSLLCLCLFLNKISDKGRTGSAWK
jgi:hypothetical protein